MAKGNSGGRRGAAAQQAQSIRITTTPATVAVSNAPQNATALTDQDASQLRQQQDSMYDASTTAAVKMYISNTNFDGQGHSLSQAMNYALDNGVDFNTMGASQINSMLGTRFSANDIASMQYTNAYMETAVHPIGRDVMLQRGAHDDVLRNVFGIRDYSRLSDSQLQSQLVGKTFQNTSYMSTSYDVNKNPFLSSSSGVSGGREVVFNIKAGAQTKMLFGAQKQSEIILAKGTDFRITGVRYSGNTVTPRGGSRKKQVIIDIETY